jgi:hypothetical protein
MQFGIKHREPKEPIKVSNQYLKSLGIDRFTKYRALNRLDKAGLIEIEPATSKKKQAPVVRIRNYSRQPGAWGLFRCA